MPTITIRVNDQEKASVEHAAAAAGQDVSEYVRETLKLREQHPDLAGTITKLVDWSNEAAVLSDDVDRIERRLGRLEQMAGLE